VIGKLKGTVDSFGADSVIIDVHGVGYVVHCSGRTLQALPRPGEAAVLSIETHVGSRRSGCSASRPNWNASGSACCSSCKVLAPRWRWRCLPL
jgi:hypothetical protein